MPRLVGKHTLVHDETAYKYALTLCIGNYERSILKGAIDRDEIENWKYRRIYYALIDRMREEDIFVSEARDQRSGASLLIIGKP